MGGGGGSARGGRRGWGGIAMIRATALVRALVLAAALAAAATPVTCLGETGNPLPARATKDLPPELIALLRQKKMPKSSPILLRIFKEEAELEVWKQDTTGRFQFLKIYPICRWSGRCCLRRTRWSIWRWCCSGWWPGGCDRRISA